MSTNDKTYKTLKNCNIDAEDVGLFTEFRDFVNRLEDESCNQWEHECIRLVQKFIYEFLRRRGASFEDSWTFAHNVRIIDD